MGESSVVIVKIPWNLRSGGGVVTEAETLVMILSTCCQHCPFCVYWVSTHLVLPRERSTVPYSWPKFKDMFLNWSAGLSSRRRPSLRAAMTKSCSLTEASCARGISKACCVMINICTPRSVTFLRLTQNTRNLEIATNVKYGAKPYARCHPIGNQPQHVRRARPHLERRKLNQRK